MATAMGTSAGQQRQWEVLSSVHATCTCPAEHTVCWTSGGRHSYRPYWVIPNQFSKSLQVTSSELDETWFVSSTCGYMKPDKILLSYVVWLPDYNPSKNQLFLNFCCRGNYSSPHNFPILDCFVISIAPS